MEKPTADMNFLNIYWSGKWVCPEMPLPNDKLNTKHFLA